MTKYPQRRPPRRWEAHVAAASTSAPGSLRLRAVGGLPYATGLPVANVRNQTERIPLRAWTGSATMYSLAVQRNPCCADAGASMVCRIVNSKHSTPRHLQQGRARKARLPTNPCKGSLYQSDARLEFVSAFAAACDLGLGIRPLPTRLATRSLRLKT